MITNKIPTIMFLFIFCFGCSQKNNSENNSKDKKQIINNIQETQVDKNETMYNDVNTVDVNQIKKQIALQSNYTCGDVKELNEHIYSKKDLDLALPLINEMLLGNGYKVPSYEDFREVINKSFKIDINEYRNDVIIIDCDDFFGFRAQYPDEVYDQCISNLFIDKKNRFITPMIALEDIFDEKTNRVKQNLKLLLFNKYLFNDDKSGIVYLANHESDFMYNLLVRFRFDEIEKANIKSIDIFYENMGKRDKYEIGDIIFTKNRSGKLFICENMLTTYTNLFEKDKNVKTILPLKYYSSYVIDNQRSKIFNAQEKNKILAYLANTYDPIFRKNNRDGQYWGKLTILADYRYYIGDEEWQKVKEEYKKNNYYNLPNLEAMIEYSERIDAAGIPND